MTTAAAIARIRSLIPPDTGVEGARLFVTLEATELSRLCRALETANVALERLDRDDGWNNVGDCVDIAREARASMERILNENA